MSRLTPMYPHRPLIDFDVLRGGSKKRRGDDPRHDDPDDESHRDRDHDHDHDHDQEHDDGNKASASGRRITLVENALKRRADELKNLQQAFTESLEGKRPLEPPIQFGTAVQRAWLHSVDPHDYRDQLEKQIDQAEMSLATLEEAVGCHPS
ncbi:hypothetical protein BGZ67_005489 [Mortierella alpina]|nr:hypothetical protein BGZ67_005489 [Mortierella alpina]